MTHPAFNGNNNGKSSRTLTANISPVLMATQRLVAPLEGHQAHLRALSEAFELSLFEMGDDLGEFPERDRPPGSAASPPSLNGSLPDAGPRMAQGGGETGSRLGSSGHPNQRDNLHSGHGGHSCSSAASGDLYLVIQGRVRLLTQHPVQGDEVSVLVLSAGDTFGLDGLLGDRPMTYRVVSSTAGQVACLPQDRLLHWFQTLPSLQEHLRHQVEQRQALIFFKTFTSLQRVPSHRIQSLIESLEETRVDPGRLLHQATPADSGHYWLRRGQIQTPAPSATVAEGADWGYPTPTPADWQAKTELHLYHLPMAQWERAIALIPALGGGTDGTDGLEDSSAGGPAIPAAPFSARGPSPGSKGRQRPATTRRLTTHPETVPPIPPPPNFPEPSQPLRRSRLWRRYPFIQQQSAADCGVTCLAMISQHWGKRPSLNTLRELAQVGRAGASLKNLAIAAETIGFQARPVRASLDALVSQTRPWIAHWQGNHYVVVYRARRQRLIIADPALGKRTVTYRQFQTGWTGYALLLEPTNTLLTFEEERPETFSKLFGLLKSYRPLIAQILLASLLIQVFGLFTPLFTQVILDRVVVQRSVMTLHVFALGLIFIGVWKVGLTAVRQYLLDHLSNRLDLTLISGFVSHVLMLPLKFFAVRHVGDIITRVQESQKLQRFLTRQVIIAWLDASMAFIYIGLMAYYNWRLTLLVVGLIPPIVILALVATPMLRNVSRDVFNSTAKENSSLVEMISGISTVKATAAEREVRWHWEDQLTTMLNSRFRSQKLANMLQMLSGLINTLGSTALLWYGANLVIQGELTIGQFVAFNMLIGQVINPILSVVQLWDEYQEAVISVERLNDVLLAPPEENPHHPMMVLPPVQGHVRFEDVTFRYSADQERNILQSLSFEAQAGQTVAIVGRSGSGKTTFINLLQGLYHPDQGRITIDGHDIRHVSPRSLRSQMGVVPQECFLFSGTILENITLNRANLSLEQVIDVARLAEAHGFIQALPLGYHTPVGERGASLSGGQRQRIAIARALLGNPRILILDEATSSLDTESESRFQRNLQQFSRDRTTFIIAHRLSTVRHANSILVLDQGHLVEQGTHDDLIQQQGLYYHLAHQQLAL